MKNTVFRSLCVLLLLSLSLLTFASCDGNGGGLGSSDFSPTLRTVTDEIGFADGFGYVVLDDGTVAISDGSAASGIVEIPEKVNGMTVTAICEAAFYGNTAITSVTLPNSTEYIGIYAFAECTSLVSVTVNDKLWEIGAFAFESTPWIESMTDEFVTVGDGVLIAYNGSDLAPTVPGHVKHVGGAFSNNTSIVGVTLHDNVLSISEYGFAGCISLSTVYFGSSLVYVGNCAFANAEMLTAALFPDTLLYLRDEVFLNCYALKFVHLGQSLVSLGDKTFNYCQGLRAAYLPKTLKSIKTSHFTDCASITLLLYGGTESEFEEVSENDTVNSFRDLAIVYEHTGGIE